MTKRRTSNSHSHDSHRISRGSGSDTFVDHRNTDEITQVSRGNDGSNYYRSSDSMEHEGGDFPETIPRMETFRSHRAISFGAEEAQQPKLSQVMKQTTRTKEFDPNLVTWDGPDDPENPLNWSRRYRWFLTAVCCLLVVNATYASSGPSSTVQSISQEMGVSLTTATLVTSIFLCGYIVGPLAWGPGSEIVGRRPLFFISFFVYALFNIGPALAQNIGTLLVTRFLSGVFAANPITNCGGVMADIWDPVTRGLAISVFSSAVFVGPVLGPIVGGFVTQSHLGWRWVFWLQLIFAGACCLICLLIPETYAPIIIYKKTKRLRKEDPEGNAKKYCLHEKSDKSVIGVIERVLFRPFKMLLVEPALMTTTLYLSYIYGILYGTFGVFPIIFEQVRGFNLGQGGLIFIGVGIGTTLGCILNAYMQRHYKTLVVTWQGTPPPEERLPPGMVAAPLLPVGLFWLCWTGAYASVPWYVPAISTILLGMSFSTLFIAFLSYIVDSYLMFAASALAANTVVRSAVGAGFPMFVRQMFNNLGIQWAGTLLGCLAIIGAPMPFLFYRYGPTIRERSSYAPAIDLKLKAKWEEEAKAKETAEKHEPSPDQQPQLNGQES